MPGPWTLFAGDEVVGRLTETSRDMWNASCAFAPAPGFDRFDDLFAEKGRIATTLEDVDDETLTQRWNELEELTAPPHLRLVADDGSVQAFGLLYVEGIRAGLRML